MGAFGVVDDCETSQLSVEFLKSVDETINGQPFLQGLVKAFDLALRGRMVRRTVLLLDAQISEELFEPVRLRRAPSLPRANLVV